MKKLLRYAGKYKLQFLILVITVSLQVAAQLYLPNLMSDIVNNGIANGDVPYIWQIGGFMLIVAFASTIASVSTSFLASRIAVGLTTGVRAKVFKNVETFSLGEIDKAGGTATLITRTTNDITQVQRFLIMALRMMIMAPIMCIGGIIMAVGKDLFLSQILGIVIVVIALVITVIAKTSMPLFKSMQKKIDKLNLVLRERLTGLRVIRAFNKDVYEHDRFDDANKDLTKTTLTVNRIMSFMMPLVMLGMNIATVLFIWFGATRIDSGILQVGDLMAFIQYAMNIMFSLVMTSMMFIMLPRASASADRIAEILDIETTITDPEMPKRTSENGGYIDFENVTFKYPNAEVPALSNLSFKAGPGEVTAIIGGTGSGKSTIFNLMLRFYDVTSGSIKIDGVDIRELTQKQLRDKIGYVPQRAVLFNGTIKENIAFGDMQAPMEKIENAAVTAQALNFINEKDEKFDSVVSQGGTNISGGQKQRLSIARALTRDASIYLFDDSFSALDFKTEANLRNALREKTAHASVIISGQRVASIMDSDRIIVLNEGEVAGIGTHDELMKTCTVYKEIVASQLSEEELAS